MAVDDINKGGIDLINLGYRDPRVEKIVLELLPEYIQMNCSVRVIHLTARAIYAAYVKGINDAPLFHEDPKGIDSEAP